MSPGIVATQDGEAPRTARSRPTPATAEQPLPGVRLLQAFAGSVNDRQRVRCSRLPPTVAWLRSWPEAPASRAIASTG